MKAKRSEFIEAKIQRPGMLDYEITVKALVEKGTIIGIGKKANVFLFTGIK